jgi:ADP-heptose:LPS heptosyltransferase
MQEETLRNLGNNLKDVSSVFETLDELRKTTPAMAIAVPVRDFTFTQAMSVGSKGFSQKCFKDKPLVMSLYHYQSLEKDRTGLVCLVPYSEVFSNVYKPYYGQNLDGKTLVVWRSGGIGDLLFIQPNIRYLKQKYPTCKIIFCTSVAYLDMIKEWNIIDRVETFPLDLEVFKSADYHLTFEGVIERNNDAKRINAYRLFNKWVGLEGQIPDSDLKPILNLSNKDIEKTILEFLSKRNINKKDYIVVQLRASSPVRTPSSRVWKELLIRLLNDNHKIVFTDAYERQSDVSKLIDFIFTHNQKKRTFNFAPFSKNINYSIFLAKYAKLVIAPDSSMVHIAAGVNTPVFGIYGPFLGRLRMETYPNSDWIEPENSMICHYGGNSCFLHGHKPCPVAKQLATNLYVDYGPSPCFEMLNFSDAFKKIRHLLNRNK